MPLDTEIEIIDENTENVFSFDIDNEEDKRLVYTFDKQNNEIKFFPGKDYFINEILLRGFDKIPNEFSDYGYIKGPTQYYLNKKFKNRNIKKFIIDKGSSDSYRKYNKGYKVTLNYDTFKSFKSKMDAIVNDAKNEKIDLADEFFYSIFPSRYSPTSSSSRTRLNKVIKNLDTDIIQHLSPSDIETFEKFYETLVEKKYSSISSKFKLITRTKLKIDKIAIQELIDEFKKLIRRETPEKKWGKFLMKYLFLVDSKYIDAIPELNLVLAGARNVDFGLIDIYGYLDIFEIKKSSTKLLAQNPDRGNYYWHTDTVKAITQAEKYLYNAERKGTSLTEDIEREIGKTVKVIKPRAILLIGNSKQLDSDKKSNDFRILKKSLKNVEVVLYDELLERLENQRNKVYE